MSDIENPLEEWLLLILTKLVSKPEEIKVERNVDEQGVLFTVFVAKSDVGGVIGKKGAIAQALRTLLRSAGHLEDVRASMKIEAPNSHFILPEQER